MFVLFETPGGYAIFKVLNEKKLKEPDNIWKEFETPEKANDFVKLVSFKRFQDTADALQATASLLDGKVGKGLKKLIKKCIVPNMAETLAVADAKLGSLIKDKFEISCVSNSSVQELMRGIRTQMDSLISEMPKKDMAAMALGLAHSLSRYKLKFSSEKVDTMIIQAVSLLDDLDKELNNYVMRCREWYGWHFPELGKILQQDHNAFAKSVKKIGMRQNASSMDLTDVLPEDVAKNVQEAAEISMGTEISETDIANIIHLCDQIIEISSYRTQLYEYLKNRMMALAPNLTILLGELVGARLISHAGSLMNLAKYPASTVQILGAEKALFRALKTKRDTPKYGLIYHAQLIGHTPGQLKGKMSRMLAAKAAIATRVDALGEDVSSELGTEHRARLEARIKQLQEVGTRRISGTGKEQAKFAKHRVKTEATPYDVGADSTIPKKRKIEELPETPSTDQPEGRKKHKRDKRSSENQGEEEAPETPADQPEGRKKHKRDKRASENQGQQDDGDASNGVARGEPLTENQEESEEPTMKKKKKSKKQKE